MQHTLPETVKTTLFIQLNQSNGTTVALACDMTQYGYTLLGTHEVEVPVPQVDLIEREVESLNKQASALRDETQARLQAIDDRINSLLAIEHKLEPSHEH